jgi:hypothetical protein
MPVSFDASAFPLVVFHVPARPELEQVREIYREYDEHLARGRHVILVDLRKLNPLHAGPLLRQAASREAGARKAVVSRTVIAEAVLVTGPVVRGFVTAFEWMRPSARTFPLLVTESEKEARTWLAARLREDAKA